MKFYRLIFLFVLFLQLLMGPGLHARSERSRFVPDPYYPQLPNGELRLNYYYNRSGRWVKFSDWIPYKQHKYEPLFLEDFYQLYGLPYAYRVQDIKESIYFLVQALTHRFRHPRNALCRIQTEEEYHKYRLLMFMRINLTIMRMYMRLGSMYDKRHLYFHDLDFADDLEISFLIARTYYNEALVYWKQAEKYANEAHKYPFEIDLPQTETDRFLIVTGKLDYGYIIGRHLGRLEAKLDATSTFLDEEGRPRPVKKAIQKDMESIYDDTFNPDPLDPPELDPEWK